MTVKYNLRKQPVVRCRYCARMVLRRSKKQHQLSLLCAAERVEWRMWCRGYMRFPAFFRVWRLLRATRIEIRRGFGQLVHAFPDYYVRSCNYVPPWAAAAATVLAACPTDKDVTSEWLKRATPFVRWCAPTTNAYQLITVPRLLVVVRNVQENVWRGLIRVPVRLPCSHWLPGPYRRIRNFDAWDLAVCMELDGAKCVDIPDKSRDSLFNVFHSIVGKSSYLTRQDVLEKVSRSKRDTTFLTCNIHAAAAEHTRKLLLDIARKG